MVKLRTLGRTGLQISEIGFGCGGGAGLMVSDDEDAQIAAVARALDRGITYFDTAPIYGDHRSERNLGRALRKLDAKPIVTTKVALELADLGDIAGAAVASVENSLERLGRDMVEVVYLHNRVARARAPKPDIGVGALLTESDVLGKGGVVDGFERLRQRGLVKFFGCCSYGGEMEVLESVIGSDAFDALLVHYNIITQTAWLPPVPSSQVQDHGRIGAHAAARGMGTSVLRVLEVGLLAGNSREAPSAKNEADRARASALTFLQGDDATLAPAAIRFALSNADVSVVLIGVTEFAHVDAAVDAAERGPLSVNDLKEIEVVRQRDFKRARAV
jgi:aryl-alcohol dehydrogenase-like predicted oxidoreductase